MTPWADDNRRAILEAAKRVFVEKGFAGASMSKIAREAGVTQSLIHYHFRTKQALWQAVKSDLFERYSSRQREAFASEAPTAELLETAIRTYFRFLAENPEFVRLHQWHDLDVDSASDEMELRAVGIDVTMEGAEKIRQAQERGLLRDDVHPLHVISLFTSAAQAWFASHSWHAETVIGPTTGCCGVELDEAYLDSVVKILMNGLRPR